MWTTSTLANLHPFLLGSPARCTFLSYYRCIYYLGSPARSRLSHSCSCHNRQGAFIAFISFPLILSCHFICLLTFHTLFITIYMPVRVVMSEAHGIYKFLFLTSKMDERLLIGLTYHYINTSGKSQIGHSLSVSLVERCYLDCSAYIWWWKYVYLETAGRLILETLKYEVLVTGYQAPDCL